MTHVQKRAPLLADVMRERMFTLAAEFRDAIAEANKGNFGRVYGILASVSRYYAWLMNEYAGTVFTLEWYDAWLYRSRGWKVQPTYTVPTCSVNWYLEPVTTDTDRVAVSFYAANRLHTALRYFDKGEPDACIAVAHIVGTVRLLLTTSGVILPDIFTNAYCWRFLTAVTDNKPV